MPCHTRGRVAEASEGRGAAPGSGPAARGPVLLLAKHGVLEALGEAELADALRGDLEWLAGLGIPSDPRLAVREHELAEARQHELAALLGFPARERQRLVEDPLDLLLGEGGLLRKVREGRGLRHRLRHGEPPLDRMGWDAKCISTIAGHARLPAREAELAGRDQAAVRPEAPPA